MKSNYHASGLTAFEFRWNILDGIMTCRIGFNNPNSLGTLSFSARNQEWGGRFSIACLPPFYNALPRVISADR